MARRRPRRPFIETRAPFKDIFFGSGFFTTLPTQILDFNRAALEALPEVVDAVGGKVPVLLDSGIRSGGDIVKALA